MLHATRKRSGSDCAGAQSDLDLCRLTTVVNQSQHLEKTNSEDHEWVVSLAKNMTGRFTNAFCPMFGLIYSCLDSA